MSWAVPAALVLGGGLSLWGSSEASKAAGKAAEAGAAANAVATQAMADAMSEATQVQYKMFQEGKETSMPWINAGAYALEQLTGKPIYEEQTQEEARAELLKNTDLTALSKDLYERTGKYLSVKDVEDIIGTLDIGPKKTLVGYEEGGLLSELSKGPGEFKADPGYNFRLAEGQKALERSQSARGMTGSGSAAKELLSYGQQMGSNEYQNFINRYWQNQQNTINPFLAMAGLGQVSAGGTQSAASSAGSGLASTQMQGGANMANMAQNLGNIRATGYMNQSNAQTGGINNMLYLLGNLAG